ncbi:MAG: YcxB family protein [Flavobacteriaceae bacterium]|jgi:Ca2+/Na+ antiporter|nr:YcxB family protein [Flavobacteriaceae bacterium]
MIQLKINLSEDDYVHFLMDQTKKNPQLQKNQKRGKYLFFTMFLALAATFFFLKNYTLVIYFVVFGILFLFLYPLYMRWFYRNYYKKNVIKQLKDTDKSESFWTLGDRQITEKRNSNEATIQTADIQNVEEIEKYFYIHLKSGTTLIFPKNQLENIDEVREYFNEMENKTVN